MKLPVLLGGICHPGRVEIAEPQSADSADRLEAVVDRLGSHNLTRERLDKLLARLDLDRSRAGEKYQILHRKLVKLFEWRGSPCAENLADETIDRVAQKLDHVEIRDVSQYALGVAQNVLKESQRATAKNAALDEIPAGAYFVNPNEHRSQDLELLAPEKRLECLDKCVQRLPSEERKMVLEYYQEHKSASIRKRREMAERIGISLVTLRVQAHRIRCKLAACVTRCLAELE